MKNTTGKVKRTTDKQSKSRPDTAVNINFASEAFRRRPINFFYVAVFLAIMILGINLGVILWISDPQLKTTLSDVISPIVDLSASIALFIAAKNSTVRSKRLAMAWGSIALAMFLYTLGDIIWLILEVGLKVQPFPSIADGVYLAYYPVSLVGVFLLLDRSATTGERINKGLDIAIVLGAAILGFWNFLIGPIIVSNAGLPLLEQGILLAYPVGDLVLFGALLLMIYNRSYKQDETPIFILFGSLLVTIIADSIYSYQSLLGTYVSGGFLDLSWIVSSLLMGLAGISQLVAVRSTNITEKPPFGVALQIKLKAISPYLPYFGLAGAYVLLVEGGLTPLPMSFLSLSIGVGGIFGLILVRQIITLSENKKLNDQLQTTLGRFQIQSVELEKTNLELQTDIAERKQTEESLRTSETQLSEALRIARMAYWEYDVILDQFTFNDQFYHLFRTTAEQEGGYIMPSTRYAQRFVHPEDAALVGIEIRKALETTDPDYQTELDHRIIRADGEVGYLSVHIRIEKDAQGRTVKTHGVNQDITERKQAEAARQKSEALFRTLFELSPDAILLIDPHDPSDSWPIVDCNAAACRMNGYTRDEMVGHSIDTINFTYSTPAERSVSLEQLREAGIRKYVAHHRRKNGTDFLVEVFTTLFTVGGRELIVGIDHDITERSLKEEEIKQRLAELEAVNHISTALRVAQTLDEMLPLLLDTTLDVLHATQGAIWLYDPVKNELRSAVIRGWDKETVRSLIQPEKPGEGINGYAFATGQPYVASDFHLDSRLPEAVRQWTPPGMGGAAIPIRAGQNVIGTFDVNVSLPRELTPGEIHLLTTLSEIAGNAIQRTKLHQQTERRLQQLAALSNIDRAISSTFDLRLSLGLLLEHVTRQLGADATDVLLFNPSLHTLEFSAGRGFRTKPFEQARLRLGEGYAGQAALKREAVHIPNLAVQHDNPRLEKHLADEQFVSYYGVPLIAKGQVMGVLEIFQRAPLEPDKEWLDFLDTLAGQAAIAIDSVIQFDSLQRSNSELSQAYNETIEGWSHALDLRDNETEGHTRRVTEMTVSLAGEAGLGEAELVQVRWGSLLHDIGKMGVPDGILLKPGPLTDEEWVIMKKHPTFAYEMISPIRYLRAALDIPYCHHEKWDGTGYPRGLKGEQIPLTARIFAVVDVWDALCSDRPYRKAWPEEKVRDHIQAGSGMHFDPQIVKAFFKSKVFLSRNRQ